MKKILITANTDRHIQLCHLPYIEWLQNNNYEVDVATNTSKKILNTNKINLGFTRKPFSICNIKAIKKLKKILKKNEYNIIHTHTPVGSVVTRIACRLAKCKAKIIYTCHGFHFYKGAPLHYWLIYYPIEKFLMKYTDVLVVMNNEDYVFAKKHFKNVKIKYVKGVGFNQKKLNYVLNKQEEERVLQTCNISENDFIVSYIAEYSNRKRQKDLIKYLAKTDIGQTNIKILLIGDDILKGKIQRMIRKYNMTDTIKTIDFTKDINQYLHISNIVVSTSRQEGLPLNILEAIYKKKYVIATKCRGNVDLIINNVNGSLIDDITEILDKIKYVQENYENLMLNYTQGINIEEYNSDNVLKHITAIYEEIQN